MTDSIRAEARAELARCRDEIERIDAEVVRLLAERMAIGKRTGELKRAAGLPIADPEREADVLRSAARIAEEVGLPPEAVTGVFARIVEMSRRAQEGAV